MRIAKRCHESQHRLALGCAAEEDTAIHGQCLTGHKGSTFGNKEGDRIGDPLEQSRLFPPMVVHMIGVGEESGSLDFMLQKIADFYEAEVEAQLASLTAALEPIMIVSLGFIVGFIVISMFLPLVRVIERLSSGGGEGEQ